MGRLSNDSSGGLQGALDRLGEELQIHSELPGSCSELDLAPPLLEEETPSETASERSFSTSKSSSRGLAFCGTW